MLRSLTKNTILVRAVTLATLATVFTTAPIAFGATGVNRCNSIFETDFQKLPKPSEIAKDREGEVHSLPGQAAIMLKVTQIIPAGRYTVVVRDRTGESHAETLAVSYSVAGMQLVLGNKPIFKTEPGRFKVSNEAGREGNVEGGFARMRLDSRRDANHAVFINSTFSGNTSSAQGVLRRDSSVEVTLTQRQPVVILFKEAMVATTESGRAENGLQTEIAIEIRGRVQAP